MAAMAVVQLGFATRRAPRASHPLTSGTTSGTSASYRSADELSMTSAPCGSAAMARACSSANAPDAARNTTSHARALATLNSSHSFTPHAVGTSLPTDRGDANTRSSATGKPRVARLVRSSSPTAPVTPTMPTV